MNQIDFSVLHPGPANPRAENAFDAAKLTRESFLKAKALHHLACVSHEQSNFLDGVGQDELGDIYAEISSKLHDASREIFPLYPHPNFTDEAVQDWLRENNFEG